MTSKAMESCGPSLNLKSSTQAGSRELLAGVRQLPGIWPSGRPHILSFLSDFECGGATRTAVGTSDHTSRLTDSNCRNALAHSPFRTQCATSLVLFTSGVALAQRASSDEPFDFKRFTRMAAYAVGIFTPWHWACVLATGSFRTTLTDTCRWQRFANRHVIMRTTALTVATRVTLEQLFITPPLVASFFASQALLQAKGVREAAAQVQEKWWDTQKRSWCVWIPVSIGNFAVTPPAFRVPLVALVSFFWQGYMSCVPSGLLFSSLIVVLGSIVSNSSTRIPAEEKSVEVQSPLQLGRVGA